MLLKSAMLLFAFILVVVANAHQPDMKTYIVSLHRNATNVQSHFQWIRGLQDSYIDRREDYLQAAHYNIGDWNGYCIFVDLNTAKIVDDDENVKSIKEAHYVPMNSLIEQQNAPWSLASLSQPSSSEAPSKQQSYIYDETAGEGTWAYVLDTGIDLNHDEFEGRAISGFECELCHKAKLKHDHGTSVAGVIGSKTYGVAKKTSIVDVRIGWGYRYFWEIKPYTHECLMLEGLEWAVRNITNTPGRAARSVINLSAGGPALLGDAFDAAYDAGILIVVAAGNNKTSVDAWPALEPSMITVGAVDENNVRANFSNYGPRIDLFAPGVSVPTVGHDEGVDGTSFSAPLVAGLALQLKGKESLPFPGETTDRIKALAHRDMVKDARDSPNLLAYIGDQWGYIKPQA